MLSNVADPILVLQVFAARYRSGEIAPGGNATRSQTLEAALRPIGQTMASVGARYPRYTTQGQMQYRIQQQLKGYARQDSPATRVKPIPFTIITHTLASAHSTMDQAIADLATIGIFFLLRPGEHTASSQQGNTKPFRLCDVTFRIGAVTASASSGALDLIPFATFVTLTFTKQKKWRENKIVGHSRSGHVAACPVLALVCRTLHLRHNQATHDTQL
jgi:hypothetical protein